MLKIEQKLMESLIYEVWKFIGRSKEYPNEWTEGLLKPIYKKAELDKPQNYRPLCMI